MKKAPWSDFYERDIFEGDVIIHPSGQRGVVILRNERDLPEDQWVVQYDEGFESRLCLQVGDRGRAVVQNKEPTQ